MPEGTVLTKEHLRIVRPGMGLQPKHVTQIIGMELKRFRKAGDPVSWKDFI
jgi:N-acetylneuraminate synthase